MAHQHRKYGRLIQKEFGVSYQAGLNFATTWMPKRPDTIQTIAATKEWIKKKYQEEIFDTGLQKD